MNWEVVQDKGWGSDDSAARQKLTNEHRCDFGSWF
jgi:hypothetical protein